MFLNSYFFALVFTTRFILNVNCAMKARKMKTPRSTKIVMMTGELFETYETLVVMVLVVTVDVVGGGDGGGDGGVDRPGTEDDTLA